MAAAKPTIVKLNSYTVHSTRPSIIGMRDNCTNMPFFSFRMMYAINAVNNGPELLIVSTNETATYLNDMRPSSITKNLTNTKYNAPSVNKTLSSLTMSSKDDLDSH